MGPEEILRRADAALNEGAEKLVQAKDHIEDYWAWRNRGGHEPPGGDEKADQLEKEIDGLMGNPRPNPIKEGQLNRYLRDPQWTPERLRDLLRTYRESRDQLQGALDRAVIAHEVDDWEDLPDDWGDTVGDYYWSEDHIETIEAALEEKKTSVGLKTKLLR